MEGILTGEFNATSITCITVEVWENIAILREVRTVHQQYTPHY